MRTNNSNQCDDNINNDKCDCKANRINRMDTETMVISFNGRASGRLSSDKGKFILATIELTTTLSAISFMGHPKMIHSYSYLNILWGGTYTRDSNQSDIYSANTNNATPQWNESSDSHEHQQGNEKRAKRHITTKPRANYNSKVNTLWQFTKLNSE